MSVRFYFGASSWRAKGFTLIEIMMVVAIMGIILLIAIPSVYYQFHKESLRKAVEDMSDACTQARSSAILDQRKTALVIFPQSVRAPGFNAKFGEGIVIDKLWLHGEDYTDLRTVRTEAHVEFHPDGTCDAAVIGMRRVGRRTRRDIVHLGKMAKKKSEQIQLEVRHAIDDLVEDISEKMQEGMDRGRDWTDNTTQGVLQALNSGKDHIRKELESIISRRP